MLSVLRSRLHKDEEDGFTLIELMVVVLIIAILIAIAIPTFLGARTRAQERSAQSNLRNALTAAKTLYTDTEDYTAATPAALENAAPELAYAATASTGEKVISVATNATKVQLAVWAKSGKCFTITDDVAASSAGTTGPTEKAGNQAACVASVA